jgi:hypothetical protein
MIRSQGLRRELRPFNLLVNRDMCYLERKVVGTWRMVLNYLELKAQELHEGLH